MIFENLPFLFAIMKVSCLMELKCNSREYIPASEHNYIYLFVSLSFPSALPLVSKYNAIK